MAKAAFFQFPRAFYVINGIELLERGAFYTMNYVLATYLATTLLFPAEQIGLIASILFLLLYIIPLLGAALAEKFGYKAALVLSFAFLTAGYGTLLAVDGFWGILGAVTLIGVGAGVFKPIAAAVVSQSSSEEQRNYAFIIYYGAINLGATVFPLIVGLVALSAPELTAIVAFGTAAILSALNITLCISVWRNLRAPDKEKSVLRALGALGEIAKYPKLLILFVIYSGFWFLYAMSLSFVPVYMTEFSRMPAWFNVLLLGVVNPAVIVAVAPFLGKLTKPFQSLPLMVAGISLYVLGFVILGFSNTSLLFLAGIVIFSLGEVLTHPSFLAYVSKVAPPDKVSVFLGYGFLPIAFGLFFGAGVGGVLYARYAQQQSAPATFWAIMSAVALVTVALLLVYNHFVSRPKREVAPGPAEPRRSRGGFGTFGLAALVLLAAPALVMASSLVPATVPAESTEAPGDALDAASLVTVDLATEAGQAAEGEVTEHDFTLPDTATGDATFTLTWQDEAAATPGGVNAPDSFKVHVQLPDGTTIESEEQSSGELVLTTPAMPGTYIVHVELVNAGDSSVASTPLGPVPLGGSADAGNDFELQVQHQAQA